MKKYLNNWTSYAIGQSFLVDKDTVSMCKELQAVGYTDFKCQNGYVTAWLTQKGVFAARALGYALPQFNEDGNYICLWGGKSEIVITKD